MTEQIKNLGIEHKEDEKGNIVISADDALKYASELWGEDEPHREDTDTDQDTPA